MIMARLAVALLLLAACALAERYHSPRPTEHPKSVKPLEELPSGLFWGNGDGVNYLTPVKNQHIPRYCGSCWAQAATSAVSDRIKIGRNATWLKVVISAQPIPACDSRSNLIDHGCDGGNGYTAYDWTMRNTITEDSCSNYQALGWEDATRWTTTRLGSAGTATQRGVERLRSAGTMGLSPTTRLVTPMKAGKGGLGDDE